MHTVLIRPQFPFRLRSGIGCRDGMGLALWPRCLRNFRLSQHRPKYGRRVRKRTLPDQKKFYGIALGSLRECEAILELEEINNAELLKQIDQLGAILYTLTKDRSLSRTDNQSWNETETATETE
jgi:hypothetical protein